MYVHTCVGGYAYGSVGYAYDQLSAVARLIYTQTLQSLLK